MAPSPHQFYASTEQLSHQDLPSPAALAAEPTAIILRNLCQLDANFSRALAVSNFESKESISDFVAEAQQNTKLFCDLLKAHTSLTGRQHGSSPTSPIGPRGTHSMQSPPRADPSSTPLKRRYAQQRAVTSQQGWLDHSTRRDSAYSSSYGTPEPQPAKTADILLTTTLMTTYILAVRTWERIFTRLHLIISGGNNRLNLAATLPDLQIQMQGEDLHSNPALQIILLHQDISSRMGLIRAFLGIASNPTERAHFDDEGKDIQLARSQVLITDPLSISIQQIILAQAAQMGLEKNEGGNFTLSQLMDEVKRRIIAGGFV